MRRSFGFALASVCVLGCLFAWHYYSKTGAPVPLGEQEAVRVTQASTTPSTEKKEPFSASLAEVMASGGDYGCHYTSPVDGGEVIGTVFISQGRARGTFVGSALGEGSLLWYFLINTEHYYVWFIVPESAGNEFVGKAILFDVTAEEERAEAGEEIKRELADLYGCVPWEFEGGFFSLPKDLDYVNEKGERILPD